MDFKKEITQKLNHLLQNNLDSSEIYQKAFEKTNDVQLKVFFRNRSEQRQNFAGELRAEVLQYGQIPKDEPSSVTSIRKGWINLKTLFANNDKEIVLQECLKSDEKAMEDYNELITKKDLPPTLDSIFARQHKEIQNTINKDKLYLNNVVA